MKANTPLELLFQNTKDIASLKQQIAPVYACTIDLGTESASVSVADTNLTTDLEKAFIVDTKGDLYKFIAFNDDKTTAYIEYYTNVKGPKGDTGDTGATGADGQDGADGYSICYSSDDFDEGITTYTKANLSANVATLRANDVVLFKNGYLVVIYSVGATTYETANGTAVLLEIGGNENGGNVWHTWTKANFIDGEATFNIGNIIKPNDMTLNIADKILYIDNNDNITECYMITDIGDISVTLEKIGDFGKKLYQHNIMLKYGNRYIAIQIPSDNDTPFTILSLVNWLYDNGFTSINKSYGCEGYTTDGNANIIWGCYASGTQTTNFYASTGSSFTQQDLTNNWTITDTIITL